MAKRRKVLPARKQDRSRDDESLLIRSAESLGRMIGSLQRQLDDAQNRLSKTADDVMENIPDIPLVGGGSGSRRRGAAKSAARKRAPRKSASSARKKTGTRSARKPSGSRKSTPSRTRAASRSSKKR
jgi:hypothetical protein